MELNGKKILRCLEAYRNNKVETNEFAKIEPFLCELPSRLLENSPYSKPATKSSNIFSSKTPEQIDSHESIFFSILSTTLMRDVEAVKQIWNQEFNSYFSSTLVKDGEYTLETFPQVLSLYLTSRNSEWTLLKEIITSSKNTPYYEPTQNKFASINFIDKLCDHLQKLGDFQTQGYDFAVLSKLSMLKPKAKKMFNTANAINESYFQQFQQKVMHQWNIAVLEEVQIVLQLLISICYISGENAQYLSASQYLKIFELFCNNAKFPLCQNCFSILSSTTEENAVGFTMSKMWKYIDNINNLLFLFGVQALSLTDLLNVDLRGETAKFSSFAKTVSVSEGEKIIGLFLMNEKQDGILNKTTSYVLFQFWHHFILHQQVRNAGDRLEAEKWKRIFDSIFLVGDEDIVSIFHQKLLSLQAIYPRDFSTPTFNSESSVYLSIEDEQREDFTTLVFHLLGEAFHVMLQFRFFPIDSNIANSDTNDESQFHFGTPENISSSKSRTAFIAGGNAVPLIENQSDLPAVLQIMSSLYGGNDILIQSLAELFLEKESDAHPMKQLFLYLITYSSHNPDLLLQYLVAITKISQQNTHHAEEIFQLYEYLYNTLQNTVVAVQTRSLGAALTLDQHVNSPSFTNGTLIGVSRLGASKSEAKLQYLSPSGKDGRLELQDLNMSSLNDVPHELTSYNLNSKTIKVGSIVRYKSTVSSPHLVLDNKKMTYLAFSNGFQVANELIGEVVDIASVNDDESKIEYLVRWQDISISWWNLLALGYLDCYLTFNSPPLSETVDEHYQLTKCLMDAYPVLKLFTAFIMQLQCNHMKMHLNFPYLFSTTLLGGILSAYFCVDYGLTYDHYSRMIELEIYPSVLAMYSPEDCVRVLKSSLGIIDPQSLHKIMKTVYYNFSSQYDWFDNSTPSRGVIGSKVIYHPLKSNQLLRLQIGSNMNDSANEVLYLFSWHELLTKVIVSILLYDLHIVWSQNSPVNAASTFHDLCSYVNTLELISLSLQQSDFNLNQLILLELFYSLQSLKDVKSSSNPWCDVWRILSLDHRIQSEAIYGQIDVKLTQIGHFIISKHALTTNANFFNAFQQHLLLDSHGAKEDLQVSFEQIERKFRYYQQSFKFLLESTSITVDLMDFYFESLIRHHGTIISTKPQTMNAVCKKDRIKLLLNILRIFQDDILPHAAASLFDAISNISTEKKCTLTDPTNLSHFSYILFQYLTTLPSYLLGLAVNNQQSISTAWHLGKQKNKNWGDILSGSGGTVSKGCSPLVNSLFIEIEKFVQLHDEHIVSSMTELSNGELFEIFTVSNACAGLLVQLFSHPLYTHNEKNLLIIQEILNRLLAIPLLPVGPYSQTSNQNGVVGESSSLLPFFFNQSMSELISSSVLGSSPNAIQSFDQYHYVLAVSSYSTMSFSSYPYRSIVRALRTRCRDLLNISFAFATATADMSVGKNQSVVQSLTPCQWFNTIPVTSFISWFQQFISMLIKSSNPKNLPKLTDLSLSDEIVSGWKVVLNLIKHHPHIFSLFVGYSLSLDSHNSFESDQKGNLPHLHAYAPITSSPLVNFYLNMMLPQIEEVYSSHPHFLSIELEVLSQIFFQAKRYPIFRSIVNTILSKSSLGGKFWDYLLKPLILDPPMVPDVVSNLDIYLEDFIPPSHEALVALEMDEKDDESIENRHNISLNEVFDLPMTSSENNFQTLSTNMSECEWNMLFQFFPIISIPIESEDTEKSQPTTMLNLKKSFYLRKLIINKEHFLEQLQCLKLVLQFLSWERYGSLYELGDVLCAQNSSKHLMQNFYTNSTTKAKFQHTIYRYFSITSASPLTSGVNLVNFEPSLDLEGHLKSYCSALGVSLKDIIHNASQSGSQRTFVPFIPLFQLFQGMIMDCIYFSYLPFTTSSVLTSSTVLNASSRNFLTAASVVPFQVYRTFSIREVQAAEISFFSEWKIFLQLFVLPGCPLRQHYFPKLSSASSSTNTSTISLVGSESPVVSLGAMSPITNQPDASPMTAKESTFQGDKRSYEVISKLLDSLIHVDAIKTPGKAMSKEDEEGLFDVFVLNNTGASCFVHCTYDYLHLFEKLRLLLSMFHHQLQEVFYKDMQPEDSLVAPRDRDQSRLSYDKIKKSLLKLAVIYAIFFPSKQLTVRSDKESDKYLSFLYPSIKCLHGDYNSVERRRGAEGILGTLSLLHPRFLISCENQISYSLQFKIQIEFFTMFSLLVTTLAGYDSEPRGGEVMRSSKEFIYNIAQGSFSTILSIFGMDSLLATSDDIESKSNLMGWEITLKEVQILMKLSCQLMKLTYHSVGNSVTPKNRLTFDQFSVKTSQIDAASDWTTYIAILYSLYNAPMAENLPKYLTNFRSSVKNLFACNLSESYGGHSSVSFQNISTGTKTLTTSGSISHTSMHHITMTTKTTTSMNVLPNQQPWTSLNFDGEINKSTSIDHEDYNSYLYYMLQMNELLLQCLQSFNGNNAGLKTTISVSDLMEVLRVVNASRLFVYFQEALVSQSNPKASTSENISIEARLESNSSSTTQPMNAAIMSMLMGYSSITGDESLLSMIWQRTLVLLETVFVILNRLSGNDGPDLLSKNQENLIHQLSQFHTQYEDLLLFPFTSFISTNLTNKSNFPYRYSSQQIQLVQKTYHYLHSLERYLPNARTYFPKLYATAKAASGFYLSHWIPLLLQYQEINSWQSTMTSSPVASQVLFSHLLIVSPTERKYCHPSSTYIQASATTGSSNKSSSSISSKSIGGDNLHVRFGANEVFTLPSVNNNASNISNSSSSVTDSFISPSGKTIGTGLPSTPTSILKSTKKPGTTFGVPVSTSSKVSGTNSPLSVKESFPGSCFLQHMEHVLVDAVHEIIVFVKSFLSSPDDYLPLATANVSGLQSAADYPIGCSVYYLTPVTSDPTSQSISIEAASKEITTSDLVRGWEVQQGIVNSVHKHDKKAQKLTTHLGGKSFPSLNFNNSLNKSAVQKSGEMTKKELLPDGGTCDGDDDFEVYLDILHTVGTMDRNTPSHYVVYLLPPLIPFISTRHLINQYTSHLQQLPHYHPHVKQSVHPSPHLFQAGEYIVTNPMLSKVNGLTDSNILPAISTGHLVLLMHYLYSSDTYNRLTNMLPRIPTRGGTIGAMSVEIHQQPEILKIFMMECWIVIMSCLQHHSYAPLGQEQVMIKQLNELAELLRTEPIPSASHQSSLWNSGNIPYAKDDQHWHEMVKKLQDVWQETYYRLYNLISPTAPVVETIFTRAKTPRKSRFGLREKVDWVHTHEDI